MKKEKIIACGVVLLLLLGMGFGYILGKKTYEEPTIKKKDKNSNYSVEKYEGDTYYIYEKEYDGDYSLDIVNLGHIYDDLENEDIDSLINNFEKQGIFSYKEYISYMNQWNIKAKFDDDNKDYLILSYAASGMPSVDVKLADVEYIRMNKRQNALDVSVLHNEKFKKFCFTHKDENVLNCIKNVYDDYFQIAMKKEVFPEDDDDFNENKNIFDI
jgi:hypothetical protein